MLFFLVLFAASTFALVVFRPAVLRFLTSISPDRHLSSPSIVILVIQTYIVAGFLFWNAATEPDRPALDGQGKAAIAAALALFTLFHLQSFLPHLAPLFAEDSLFESLTAVFALAAAILFAAGGVRAGKGLARAAALALGLGFLFIGLEEISWGQRILGWTTPAGWGAINYQGEANLHNLFNPVLPLAYLVFNAVLTVLLFLAGKLRSIAARRPRTAGLAGLIPAAEAPLFGALFLALVPHGTFMSTELTEIIFSVLGLSQAIRWLRTGRGPNRRIPGQHSRGVSASG
jgi:hypothetical protein